MGGNRVRRACGTCLYLFFILPYFLFFYVTPTHDAGGAAALTLPDRERAHGGGDVGVCVSLHHHHGDGGAW